MSPSLRQLLWPMLSAAALAGCASGPDPTEVKLNDVDERLGRIERVVSNQSLLTMSQRIDALESQVRELRGTVEELQNGNEAMRKQQRDLYADLDQRIKALEGALKAGSAGAAGGVAPPAGATGGATADDQTAYNRAFEAL